MGIREVPLQKVQKVEKKEIAKQYVELKKKVYKVLAIKYNWGPDYVSRLNPHQQWWYATNDDDENVSNEMKFETMEDYEVWAKANNKPLPKIKVK